MMNFSNFEYFYTLSKSEGVADAARKLNISQQALSAQIRRLEEELGVPLITKNRPASLTPCGEVFAQFSGEMLLQRQQLMKRLWEMTGQHQELLISLSPGSYPPALTRAMTRFAQKMPECTLRLEERGENFTENDLKKYDFHLSSQQLPGNLEHIALEGASNPPGSLHKNSIVVGATPELLRAKWGENWRMVAEAMQAAKSPLPGEGLPFIRITGFAGFQDRYFAEKKCRSHTVATVTSPEAGFALCRAGVGALLAPNGWLEAQLRGDTTSLYMIPLGEPYPGTELFVSYEKGKQFSPPEALFLQCLCATDELF